MKNNDTDLGPIDLEVEESYAKDGIVTIKLKGSGGGEARPKPNQRDERSREQVNSL